MIRIKEEWWGPTIKDSVVSSIQEEREMDKGNKRRRSNAIVRAGEEYNGESSYVGKQHEANSVALEPGDNLNSSKSRNNSRRDLRPPSFSESRSPRVYANPSTATSRKKKRSSRASRSHPWLSSRPAPPPPRRFATPPLSSLRSAVSVLDTPIVILQENLQFPDYAPFLNTQPIEPIFSLPFYRNQIEFFTSVSAAVNWSNRVGSKIFNRPHWPKLTEEIMSLEPNFDFIRKQYPLRLSSTRTTGPQMKNSEWDDIGKVLDWIYGVNLRMPEILWRSTDDIPWHTVKIHSSTQGYARGIWGVACQFEDYLDKSPSSRLSRLELRAKEMLDWLRIDSTRGKRSERWRNWWRTEVSRERDGKIAKGNYWLNEIEGLRTISDLERWEDDMKVANRWRRDWDCGK
ncbi:hypothetical protein JCM5353_005998 [Sporobolomyces roseus]